MTKREERQSGALSSSLEIYDERQMCHILLEPDGVLSLEQLLLAVEASKPCLIGRWQFIRAELQVPVTYVNHAHCTTSLSVEYYDRNRPET
jgi:hypothetical protein